LVSLFFGLFGGGPISGSKNLKASPLARLNAGARKQASGRRREPMAQKNPRRFGRGLILEND
jgi:hypothetical protein